MCSALLHGKTMEKSFSGITLQKTKASVWTIP